MKKLCVCIDSIFAGVMIAIGAVVYLNCPNRIVGAFLFSIGLIVIMEFEFSLYTGKVGYARTVKNIPYLLHVFLMNAVGCMLVLLLPIQNPGAAWFSRLETPLHIAFVKAMVCGILIYVCVHIHKKHPAPTNILTTLVAIPAFIIGGAEHSIADICFMFAARSFTLKGVTFICVVALGNAAGSLLLSIWISRRNELHKNY